MSKILFSILSCLLLVLAVTHTARKEHTQVFQEPDAAIAASPDCTLSVHDPPPVMEEPVGLIAALEHPPVAGRLSRSVNHYPLPKRIDIGYLSESRTCHRPGYTKLAVLLGPEYQAGQFLPLADVRGVALNDGTYAGNIGFIGRFLPKSLCQVYGFNVFYDVRQGAFGTYQQTGGGLEVLARRWEVRANAYVPIGQRKFTKTCVFDQYEGGYKAVRRRHEFAEYAVDASVGYYPVLGKNFQLYAAAGPYYFWGKFCTSAFGGNVLLRPQYRDYLAVELSLSHDHIFETFFQASVIFSIPLYNYSDRIKNKRGPCGVANRQIYQPIDRDIILLRRCCWQTNW